MGKRRTYFAVTGLLLSLAVFESAAQSPPPSTPARIGLVLSGGAARGCAHVGVLKVLEELRIPVDFVAGTSMGAIVGGLYSAGASPAELEGILAEIEWRDLLDDRPPRRHLPFRQKVDDQTYLVRFEAGFKDGSFRIPSGLISGQKLGFALQVMALQAIGISDFDHFPIPFRAIATDLETGEMVVLGSGDLGQAMRASMSLPGIFAPIKIEDRLLVDGGLVRNLPVDVARDMGADVIIAVDVGQPPPARDELGSISKVTSQVMGLQIRKNVNDQAAQADVLIKVDLDGFGSSQFERGLEMVPLGEAAAREALSELSQYSVSKETFQTHLQHLRQRRSFSGAVVSSVQLTSSSTSDSKFVLRQVTMRPGDPLDLEVIRQDLERLYETGDYERVDFHLTQDNAGYNLFIEAIDKSWGPNYLRFGFNLVADFEGESSFGALSSYTLTRLNRRRAEFKVQAQVGEDPEAVAELYQPLSLDQTWFTAFRLWQAKSTEYLPLGGATFAPYQTDILQAIVDVGLQVGPYAEFRLGLTRAVVSARLRGGADLEEPMDLPLETETDLGGIRFTGVVDQFDNMNFPRNGYFLVADYFASREDFGSDQDYERLIGFVGLAGSRGRHTLVGLSNIYSALGTESPETSSLGGLFNLSGVTPGEITGRYGGNFSLLYLHRFLDLPTGIGDGLYLGASIEAGNLWYDREQVDLNDLRYTGSLFIGADTVFGPLYLAYGQAENNDSAFYFFLGRTF